MHKFARLLAYARPQAGAFALIVGLSIAGSLLVALQPWPLKLIIDSVLQGEPLPRLVQTSLAWLGFSSGKLTLVALFALAGLFVAIVHVGVESWLAWIWTRAGRRVVFDLSVDLFARLQRRSLLHHARTPVADTLGRITTDSWCVYLLLDTLFISPLHAILAVAGMTWLMAQLDSTLALVALGLAPFMVVASFFIGKPLRAAAKLKREVETRLAAHLQQTLAGIPVVQAFVQEEREQMRFAQFADAAIRAQQRSTLLGSLNSLGSGLVTTLGTAVILWIGAQRVSQGTLTVGSLFVFLAYLVSLQAQMKTFASAWTTLQGLSASRERVLEVLDGPSEVADKPGAPALPRTRGRVQFDQLTFGYETGRPLLRDVSFTVEPGETIGIVGATGAGKSTLINLIPRFFDPWQGRVLIDGQDVREFSLESVRRQVALVLQEPFLVPESVAQNLVLGKADATRAEIEAAARAAKAHDFISRLPEGYDTVLGERGATLSGGERQRLAIARAFLKDAPILILDEPTSALDSATEQELLSALDGQPARTTFIIAHRLSTVARADRILVLQDGRIVESGGHAALVAQGGVYARLYAQQVGTATRDPAATEQRGAGETVVRPGRSARPSDSSS